MIPGIHILSTAPSRQMRAGKPFGIPFFELACLALSAVMWRKLNGPIKFYVDQEGYDWFKERDLLGLWDSVDNETVEAIPEEINQNVFWASAKLFALRQERKPVAMVDTDLIVWIPLERRLKGSRLTVLHREDLAECYLPGFLLKTREGYQFDPDWDWTARPCNTAFAWFGDAGFKDRYLDAAIDFMWNNKERAMENVSQMVFAEQRILAMQAVKERVQIHTLVNDPFQRDNEIFTHLWGAKNIARNDPEQCGLLVKALMNKLRSASPEMYEKLRVLQEKG